MTSWPNKPEVEPIQRTAYKINEVAKSLGTSEGTVRKLMKTTSIPYFKIDGTLRFPVAELQRWVSEQAKAYDAARSEPAGDEQAA